MAGETLPSGSTNTQGLADFAAPYITDYLGKSRALAETPYEVYKGPLTAGQSDLQTQAFKGLGSLTVPSSIGNAAQTAGKYATQAGGMSYTPQTMDFLGNANRSGATQMMQPQTSPAYAVQRPMLNQRDPGAAFRSTGMPMEDVPQSSSLSVMGSQPMPGYLSEVGTARAAPTEADWNMHQQMAMYTPGTDMEKAKADFMSGAGKNLGGPEMGAYSPANKFVQPNDPFYQSPEYKQFESESEGRIGTMDMYDSPNFGLVGSGTTGRAMDEAYGKYKAGMPAQAEMPQLNQLDPSVSHPNMPMGSSPAQTGMPQAGIAGLQPPQASQPVSNIAQQYMNPYLQAALNPQLEEARRQSQITAQQNAAKMTGAGAFGGSRQAILDAENQRNLGTNMSKITGEGYNTAYDKAMQQFNADQQRKMQEGQFGATYGLDALRTGIQGAQTQGQLGTQQSQADIANIQAKLAGGAQERGITSEGIAADKEEFEKQRQYPYQQAQFMRDMISGLPTGSVTNTAGEMSSVGSLLSALGGGTAAASALGYKNVGELLKGLGLDFGP